jgi:hypothetical protein
MAGVTQAADAATGVTGGRRPSARFRWTRRVAIAVLSLIVLCALLFVSVGPSVESRTRPNARDLEAARGAWHQLKAAQRTGAATLVRVDNGMITGLSALASDATGLARFEAQVKSGVLAGKASLSLPAGLWINASATATGRHDGFPAYRLKVGRVTFPETMSRWFADLGRTILRLRGASVPPLDEMVRQVSINRDDVLAMLALPADSGVVNELISVGGEGVDGPLVSDIYCRIAAEQRANPVRELPQVVRRAFDVDYADGTVDYNRAAFVALSFLVVGERAEALTPQAAELKKDCPHPPRRYVLRQREDLAKHWAFSAALTAVLGKETADSLGEWKELNDSLRNGSGFSFVDIAADRSGVRTALRALDPGTAESMVDELSRVTEEDLLPVALLQAPEGLSEATFVDRFGSLDQQNYRRAIAAIDQELARRRSSAAVSN